MMTLRLRHEAYPNYVAEWHPTTQNWSILLLDDVLNPREERLVAHLPVLQNRDGNIEADLVVADPALDEEMTATHTAHALLDFFWPDEEEEGNVERVVLINRASGARYEFEGPE